MGILGSAGYIYMIIMVALLIGGLGIVILDVYSRLTAGKHVIHLENKNNTGGIKIMGKNGWLKLAVFSLTGIVISIALLYFLNPNRAYNVQGYGYNGYGMQQMNMQGNYGGYGQYGQNAQHLQHLAQPQGAAYGNANMAGMQTGSNYGYGYAGMQPVNNMAGMSQPMQSTNNQDSQMLMMQMQQMQQELMMLKQQMQMNSMNNAQSGNASMSSGGSMPAAGGGSSGSMSGGGGMSMM